VYIPKPIKITKKILIPTFRHPEVDFVETIVGRNQSNLQTMARDHKCHIYVQEGDRQMIDSKSKSSSHLAIPYTPTLEARCMSSWRHWHPFT
ncbi:hypothetical protein PFISCL1PPCAC_25609, partial [Pristionchus fissidentatus]